MAMASEADDQFEGVQQMLFTYFESAPRVGSFKETNTRGCGHTELGRALEHGLRGSQQNEAGPR